LPFIFIPSNVLSYVAIPREKSNQISSMINFTRNIGGSIGIALLNTVLTRNVQVQRTYYSSRMQHGNPMFQGVVNGIAGNLESHGVGTQSAMAQAYGRVNMMLTQQASAVAYKEIVSYLAIAVLCLAPLVAIMKRPPKPQAGQKKEEAPPAH
jgi:MFS transporter, DHA2 family, multidrug resistance protein